MKSNVLQKKASVNKSPLFSLNRPLREADWKTYDRELSDLQGNILKSHGREAALYVFLTFRRGNSKRDEARKFIREFAEHVTSAKEQKNQSEEFNQRNRAPYDPKLLAGVYLTAAGYRFLGLEVEGFCGKFQGGLKNAGKRLNDPPPREWEGKFQDELHALVFFAHDYVSALVKELIELRERTEGLASISSEFGITMRNPNKDAIEHFGYADGASQPIF